VPHAAANARRKCALGEARERRGAIKRNVAPKNLEYGGKDYLREARVGLWVYVIGSCFTLAVLD